MRPTVPTDTRGVVLKVQGHLGLSLRALARQTSTSHQQLTLWIAQPGRANLARWSNWLDAVDALLERRTAEGPNQ